MRHPVLAAGWAPRLGVPGAPFPWVRGGLALLVAGVAAVAPVHALASEVAALGLPEVCPAPLLDPDAALDVVVKARLLHALCQDNVTLAVALSVLAGFLTSLSPCVYPLIPITISVFGARAATTRLKAFLLSATYVAGMSALYTVLGVVFASLGLVSGSLMAVPWVVMAMGLLCLLMAASMFGAFELSLPTSLHTRLANAGGQGFKGAFVMGLAAGVIAAPCTGPVLAVILSLISKSREPGRGVVLMASYALGMGILFLVLGTFSSALSRLPRSGRWMEVTKSVLGLAMVAVALYLVMPHVEVVSGAARVLGAVPGASVLGVGLLAAGVAAGALHLSFHDQGRGLVARKGAGLLLATAGALTLLGWVEHVPVSGAGIAWVKSHDEAVAQGRQQGKPVMVDFRADWCAACKELERVTYRSPDVVEEARRFVSAKVDCTQMTEEVTTLWERYGITGLPVVLFLDSRGEVLTDPRVDGFLAPRDYLREMRRVR